LVFVIALSKDNLYRKFVRCNTVKKAVICACLLCLWFVIPSSTLIAAQTEVAFKTVYLIAWGPDGDRIASVDYTNTVTIWEPSCTCRFNKPIHPSEPELMVRRKLG